MENTAVAARSVPAPAAGHWTVGGAFLDALTRRDFVTLQRCLAPDVRLRALVPRGPFELEDAAAVAAKFAGWFGDATEELEVVDACIGEVGEKLYLRWRMRLTSRLDPATVRVVEQHAFATGREQLVSLDLLCSGYQPEPA